MIRSDQFIGILCSSNTCYWIKGNQRILLLDFQKAYDKETASKVTVENKGSFCGRIHIDKDRDWLPNRKQRIGTTESILTGKM